MLVSNTDNTNADDDDDCMVQILTAAKYEYILLHVHRSEMAY